MALFIHSGLVQTAGSSGVGGMDILVCASLNAVQLILESRSEVLVRQTLARFFLHIARQVNETSQHIILVGIADLDHHDIGALGIFVARTLNEVVGGGESIGHVVDVAQNILSQSGQRRKDHRASGLIDSADLGVDLVLGVSVGDAVSTQSSGLVGLCSQNSSQSVVEVRLGNLRLVGQCSQTLDGNIGTSHGNATVLGAGGNQNVHHLLSDGQGNAVHLNALQDVGLCADILQSLDALVLGLVNGLLLQTQLLQCAQLCELLNIVSHNKYPP